MAAVALATTLEITLRMSEARVVAAVVAAVLVAVAAACSSGDLLKNGLYMGSRVNMNTIVDVVMMK